MQIFFDAAHFLYGIIFDKRTLCNLFSSAGKILCCSIDIEGHFSSYIGITVFSVYKPFFLNTNTFMMAHWLKSFPVSSNVMVWSNPVLFVYIYLYFIHLQICISLFLLLFPFMIGRTFFLFRWYLGRKMYGIYHITHSVYLLMVSTKAFCVPCLWPWYQRANIQCAHSILQLHHLFSYYMYKYLLFLI